MASSRPLLYGIFLFAIVISISKVSDGFSFASDGLRHRSWAATTEGEEEEKNLVVLHESAGSRIQSPPPLLKIAYSNPYREKAIPEPLGRAATLKDATKFSYFATSLAAGGILSLLVFHLTPQSGEPHSVFFKALTSFISATFVCGLSIILLTSCALPASYQMLIIKGLVSATKVFLALTGVGVSIVLLKIMSALAFLPVIVVVIVACIIVHCKQGRSQPSTLGGADISSHKEGETTVVDVDDAEEDPPIPPPPPPPFPPPPREISSDGRGLSNHHPCDV